MSSSLIFEAIIVASSPGPSTTSTTGSSWSRKRRPPDSAAAFAPRRADDLGRLRWCTYWLAHVVGLANPGSAFSPGERSGPGPGRKPLPQSGDVLRAEPERGEYPVAPLVQPLARVREVPVGQARIQPLGEADHLLHAEALQGGCRVQVITRLGPAGERAHLAADHILEIQDRADIHGYRPAGPVKIGHLQHHLFPVGRCGSPPPPPPPPPEKMPREPPRFSPGFAPQPPPPPPGPPPPPPPPPRPFFSPKIFWGGKKKKPPPPPPPGGPPPKKKKNF